MSTLFLTNDDFEVRKINNSSMLCTNIKGIVVVMFYSNKCTHCHTLIPIFKQLYKLVSGCQFGMADIGVCKNAISASKSTIDPITYVPYIVFYANKRPIIKYNGPHNINDLCKFITDVSKSLVSQSFFNDPSGSGADGAEHAPKNGHMYGMPCQASRYNSDESASCDGGVCYLSEKDAY